MEYETLGNTEISVSKIALGCWGFAGGPMWGSQDEADSMATVSAALDSGINFFENAQGYGDGYSEEVLGKALKGRRHEAIIATKISSATASSQGLEAACDQSLKRLQTDYIDLLQPHWPYRHIPVEETYQAFTKLRQAGKIRAFGVSNYGVGDLTEILQTGEIVSNQLPYSLLFRAIEYEVQPLCIERDIGILCYSTLLHGLLAGKYKTPADVPAGRGRTRHFSKNRSGTRHGEEGCEREVFTAIEQIRQTTLEASMRRLRPCLMTTATTLLALIPVLTSTGRGSDIMVPMAIPSFGGMAINVMTILVVPVLYCALEERKAEKA